MTKFINKPIIILCLITLFGAFLRSYKINTSPPSLYIDEADAGYQAYSLLETGRDYFGHFLPSHLQSFSDDRTPLYIYSDIPFVWFLGLTPFAIRLPALLFGIFSIPAIFGLSYLLLERLEIKEKTAGGLLASFILAVLPWHIQYSRMAFEATLLLFLFIVSIGLFLQWIKNSKFIFLSLAVFSLFLTPYVYSTAKLFMPLLALTLVILFKDKLLQLTTREKVITLLIIFICLLPQMIDLLAGTSTRRFAILSVFANTNSLGDYQHLSWLSGYANKYWPFIFVHTQTLAKIFLNFPAYLFYKISANYLATFSPQFLIFQGDPNLRQNLPFSGEAGFAITFLFFIGLSRIIKNYKNKASLLLIALILLAPLPSSITKDGLYHATRLFVLIMPLATIAGVGLLSLLQISKHSKYYPLIILLLIGVFSWEILRDQYIRLTGYPNYSYLNWDYGWKENVTASYNLVPNYKFLVVDTSDKTPVQTFYGLFHPISPKIFQKYVNRPAQLIPGSTITAQKFDNSNIYFAPIDSKIIESPLPYQVLALIPAADFKPTDHPNIQIVKTVTNPWGDPLYYFLTNKLITSKTNKS